MGTFRFWFLWLVGSEVWLNWEGIKIALDLNDVSVAFCGGCTFFPTLNFTFWKSFSLSFFFLLVFGISMRKFQNILVEKAMLNFYVWMVEGGVEDKQLWAAVALGTVCTSCTRAYNVTSNALPSGFNYMPSAHAHHKTLTIEGLNSLFTSCN